MSTSILATKHNNSQVRESEPLKTHPGVDGSGSNANKSRQSIVRRLSRKSRAVKVSGGYLDYMLYYHSFRSPEPKNNTDVENIIHYLAHCQHTWRRETKGELERFRGIGCGRRFDDPLCGSYQQIIISREAAGQMLLVQEAAEVSEGVVAESYGLKIVLTLPKSESVRIDKLLFDGQSFLWVKEVSKLNKMADKWLKSWFPGVPYVKSLDYAGESDPCGSHYHFNVYLLPFKLDIEGRVEVIAHWFPEGELELMRLSWRDVINEAYGLKMLESDISVGYLKNAAGLYHWLRYLYRHPLSDIWRGWRGYNDESGVLDYRYAKKVSGHIEAVEMSIDKDDLARPFERLELIPKHFKRVRWCGSLSDGQRGKTMAALGLERLDKDEVDDNEGEGWIEQERYSFVRSESDGIVLERRDDENKGTGQYIKVLDECLTYSPAGVKVGRRIVWLPPGGRPVDSS